MYPTHGSDLCCSRWAMSREKHSNAGKITMSHFKQVQKELLADMIEKGKSCTVIQRWNFFLDGMFVTVIISDQIRKRWSNMSKRSLLPSYPRRGRPWSLRRPIQPSHYMTGSEDGPHKALLPFFKANHWYHTSTSTLHRQVAAKGYLSQQLDEGQHEKKFHGRYAKEVHKQLQDKLPLEEVKVEMPDYIKKYISSTYLGKGRIENGVLYVRYRSSSIITTAEWCKIFTARNP